MLEPGWNFVLIKPEMLGLRINELASDCNIQKSYFWYNVEQEWEPVGTSEDVDREVSAQSLLLKVANKCTLTSSGSRAMPPALPN